MRLGRSSPEAAGSIPTLIILFALPTTGKTPENTR